MVIVASNKIKDFINFTGILLFKTHKDYVKNCESHRYYGAARIGKNKSYMSWWFNNKFYGDFFIEYNQKQFLKDINKLWLL